MVNCQFIQFSFEIQHSNIHFLLTFLPLAHPFVINSFNIASCRLYTAYTPTR